MIGGALYTGNVYHKRLRPRVHQLDYRLFALLLDVDRMDETSRRLRFFSRNRFNLLSIRDRDYGDGGERGLREQAEEECRAIGVPAIERIELFTLPRILGFAFNPLSLFYCYSPGGGLAAIIHEVHNTFGERHRYILRAEPSASGEVTQHSAKQFHVSPFLPMDLAYDFRVRHPGKKLSVAITVRDGEGPILVAVQDMRRQDLSDRSILSAVLAMPLMTVKVVAGILWEAAKLWGKGVKVYRHPGRRRWGRTLDRPAKSATPRRRAA